MPNKSVPTTVVIEDEGGNTAVERKYPEYENVTLFSMAFEDAHPWRYYLLKAKDILGLYYKDKSDMLTVVKMACTTDETVRDFVGNMSSLTPILDKNYPKWRDGTLFVLNVRTMEPPKSEDFMSLQPVVMGKDDGLLLTKDVYRGEDGEPVRKVYCVYAPKTLADLKNNGVMIALAKLYFSEVMARPSNKNLTYRGNQAGRNLVYQLIFGYFKSRRDYYVQDVEKGFDVLPPLNSPFNEPYRASDFKTPTLDTISTNIKKKASSTETKEETPISLNEVVSLGIDALISEFPEGEKPIELTIDLLPDIIKAARLQKNALVVDVLKRPVDVKQLESDLDTDNLIINYPDGTQAQTELTNKDLMSGLDQERFAY